MDQNEATALAFSKLGKAPGIAKRFRISNQAAQHWRTRIPSKKVLIVAHLTGVPAALLRPDMHDFTAHELERAAA